MRDAIGCWLPSINQTKQRGKRALRKGLDDILFSLLYSFISKGTVRKNDCEEEFLFILCGQE
jgi:hypothetical protein